MDTDLKKTTPLVSVVMPVYNASSFIEESINSILQQTFSDFEFIIINDASTDNSRNIISSYTDSRIRIIDNEQNLGVTRSLNKGIELARGKYIARMDADDIALPQRLEKQVNFLVKNAEYGLVGSYFRLIPENMIVRVPIKDEEIKAAIIFHNPFAHPTVMFTKNLVDQFQLYYNENLLYGQDQELWYRFSKVTKCYNIPEVLLLYRIHPTQISTQKLNQQKSISNEIKVTKIKDFIDNTPLPDLSFYCRLVSHYNSKLDLSEKNLLKQWITLIYNTNKVTKKINQKYLRINLVNLIIKFIENTQPKKIKDIWFFLSLFMHIKKIPFLFLFRKTTQLYENQREK